MYLYANKKITPLLPCNISKIIINIKIKGKKNNNYKNQRSIGAFKMCESEIKLSMKIWLEIQQGHTWLDW